MPNATTVVIILVIVAIIASVAWLVLNRQAGNKREAARELAGRFGTAFRLSGVKTPVSPLPFLFADDNGVRGALTVVHGRLHLYLEDTKRRGDARLVTGELLPKRSDGQARSMAMRPLSSYELHGECDYPQGHADGPLTINQRLNVAEKPREVSEPCPICTELRLAIGRSVTSPVSA